MSATTFIILLACLLIAAKFAGWLCHRLRIPGVLGQLLVGVVAGPSLLGWVHLDPILNSFANIGVILLMFMVWHLAMMVKKLLLNTGIVSVNMVLW